MASLDENVILKKRISTELYQEYIKVHQNYVYSSEEAGDLNFKLAENIVEIVRNLKQTTHKSNIMKECAEHFYKQANEFYNKLDTEHSHELIAFESWYMILIIMNFMVDDGYHFQIVRISIILNMTPMIIILSKLNLYLKFRLMKKFANMFYYIYLHVYQKYT